MVAFHSGKLVFTFGNSLPVFVGDIFRCFCFRNQLHVDTGRSANDDFPDDFQPPLQLGLIPVHERNESRSADQDSAKQLASVRVFAERWCSKSVPRHAQCITVAVLASVTRR